MSLSNDLARNVSDVSSEKVCSEVHEVKPAYSTSRFKNVVVGVALGNGLIALVGAIAAAIFGIMAISAGSYLAFGVGCMFSVATYDVFVVARNLGKISQVPEKYLLDSSLSSALDRNKLQEDLCKGGVFPHHESRIRIVDFIDAQMKSEVGVTIDKKA